MDTLPLPERPDLAQYRKRAKELVAAARSSDRDALREWAAEWLGALVRLLPADMTQFAGSSLTRATEHIERAVHERLKSSDGGAFTLAEAQHFIAQAHSFPTWSAFAQHIERARAREDVFETAADAVVNGELDLLRDMVRRRPDIVRARSARVHEATLLHYVAANGVEDFRQRTPPNALDVARLLLDAGAQVDALANTYGGGVHQTTLNLLVSSAHPALARLQAPLAELLLDYGAAIEGVADDSGPLLTAIAFSYPSAAEVLAKRGARVDGPVPAAALGRIDSVRQYVTSADTLAAGVSFRAPRWFQLPRDPVEHIELAFLTACRFGQAHVAEFLLDLGVDVQARAELPALHSAAGFRYPDVVRLLLQRGAQLEVRNRWGGTALDSTVWFAKNPPIDHPHGVEDVGYPAIIDMLLGAGADVDAVEPFPTGIEAIDALLRRHGRVMS